MLSRIRKKALFCLKFFQTLPACPSDKGSIVMSIGGMKDIDKETRGEEPIPLPVCQPQISQDWPRMKPHVWRLTLTFRRLTSTIIDVPHR